MSSRTSTRRAIDDPGPTRLALLAHGLGGLAFGLGLARFLFELDPFRLGFFGVWPGAAALAAVCGGIALATPLLRRGRLTPSLAAAPIAHFLALIAILSPGVNPLRSGVLLAGSLTLYVLLASGSGLRSPVASGAIPGSPPSRARAAELAVPAALFVAQLAIYLYCLAPAVGEADTFEFQVGIARLGIAHGSGYPLLMLLGKLFSLLPVGGTLAWRANLTSAFFGALAAVGVERLGRRLGVPPLIAALAGLTFGLSPTLWSRAVEVEAYTLNAALVAGLLVLSLDLLRDPQARLTFQLPHRPVVISYRTITAFTFGLSLTNHLTTILLAPAVALALAPALFRSASIEPVLAGLRSRAVAAARVLFAFLLGFSVYLYIPFRWPAVSDGKLMTLAQFTNILAGNEARGAFQWALPLRDPARWAIAFDKVVGEYGPLPLALSLAGLLSLILAAQRVRPTAPKGPARTHSLAGLLFVLAYLPYFYFALAFNVPDPDFSAFFIPLHLIAAILMARGLHSLAQPSLRVAPVLSSALSYSAVIVFTLLPLRQFWTTLPLVDQSGDWESQRLGEYILSQPLAPSAVILADSQKIAPLYYLQVAEGVRPDLDIVVLPNEAAYRAVLDERVASGQTTYLARYLPGLGAGFSLRSIGPLAEVSLLPFAAAPPDLLPSAAQPPVSGLSLLGYTLPLDQGGVAALEHLDLTLFWQAATVPDTNLLVSLRLVDDAGTVVWQSAGSVPVGGLYPTNAWRSGEIISDYYRTDLPEDVAPGDYRLEAGLFPPFAIANQGWFEIAPLRILPSATPIHPPHSLRARFGDQWLLGYSLPESAAPGATVPVTLYWLRGKAEAVTALGETRSLAAWPAGAVAPLRYHLPAPTADAALPVFVDTGKVAQCGWLAAPAASCALPPVQLLGQAASDSAINFANLLLLRGAELHTTSPPPGGLVSVELEWQALQTMSEDYTVFVHLLGPDDLVHGQVDAWPVSGTRATSSWSPGEVIGDPYLVTVASDAPPGDYQVEIGLYLLATGERLTVLNANGQPVDDRVLLAGLTITP